MGGGGPDSAGPVHVPGSRSTAMRTWNAKSAVSRSMKQINRHAQLVGATASILVVVLVVTSTVNLASDLPPNSWNWTVLLASLGVLLVMGTLFGLNGFSVRQRDRTT